MSEETTQLCLAVAKAAKKYGTLISFDLNHRATFWKGREEELAAAFHEIASEADVLVGNEEDFHAQASKKIKGAKTSIKMIRNSAKVSNFCADVIGDICGVLSGAISAMIAFKLTENYGMSSSLQFVFSAIVSSVTVGGKAVTKEIAKKHSTQIIGFITKFVNFDEK